MLMQSLTVVHTQVIAGTTLVLEVLSANGA